MIRAGGGTIVSITSIAACLVQPFCRAYVPFKAGLLALEHFAARWRHLSSHKCRQNAAKISGPDAANARLAIAGTESAATLRVVAFMNSRRLIVTVRFPLVSKKHTKGVPAVSRNMFVKCHPSGKAELLRVRSFPLFIINTVTILFK
jgi:hypothetical protein